MLFSVEDLLQMNKNQVVYVNKETVKLTWEPRFIHLGLLRKHRLTNPNYSVEDSTIKVQYKVLCTKKFIMTVTADSLKDEFVFRHIQLPEGFNRPYSKFRRSLSDMCVENKTHYKLKNQVAGGVIIGNEDKRNLENEGNDIIVNGMCILREV